MSGVSVRELKSILTATESPRKLVDPITELPLWDEQLMNQIKQAKSIEDARSAENQLRNVMEPQADEVFHNIFIGNFRGAKSIDLLKQLGINCVFNTAEGKGLGSCGPFDPKPYADAGIEYFGLAIKDNVDQNDSGQEAILRNAADKMDEIMKKGDIKLLVNCFAGLSRSTSCVIAYLILKKNMDIRDALKTVKTRRDVMPSAQQLFFLAKIFNNAHGLESPDDEEFDISKFRQLSRS